MNSNKISQKKYNDLLEKKDELTDYGEWLNGFKKKVNIILSRALIISILMTIPFILSLNGSIASIFLTPTFYMAIAGGLGICGTVPTLIGENFIFKILQSINKKSIKRNEKQLKQIKNKNNIQKITPVSKTPNQTKKISNTNIHKKTTPSQNYSYNKENNQVSHEPKTNIKIIDGKVCFVNEKSNITEPKKKTTPSQNYSYNKENSQVSHEPKTSIRIIDGKVCFVNEESNITEPKKKIRQK